MQFRTRHVQVLILVFILSAVVQTRRVIRAAPGIPKTGRYIVSLATDTSHEKFEAIAKKVQQNSWSSKIQKIEGEFAKIIVAKLSPYKANWVSLKTHTHTHIYKYIM